MDGEAKALVVVNADGGAGAVLAHRLLTTSAACGGGFQGGNGAHCMVLQVGRFHNVNTQRMNPSHSNVTKNITIGTFVTPVASTLKMDTHQ
jgi:hypothetical protein